MQTKEDSFHLGVKALIRNPSREILLLERNPKFSKACWDLPGGRIQKGESLLEALKREMKEEIGLNNLDHIQPFITTLTDIRIQVGLAEVGLIFSIFLCEISSAFSPQLSHEHIDYKWLTVDACLQKLKHYPSSFTEKLTHLI